MSTTKRDEQGNLICKRRGCAEVRTSDRECAEHAAMTSATHHDSIVRREPWNAPWRSR